MGACDLCGLYPKFFLFIIVLVCTRRLTFLEGLRAVVMYSCCYGVYFPWMFAIVPSFSLAYLLRTHAFLFWPFCICGIVSLLLLGYDYLQASLLVKEEPIPPPPAGSDFDIIMSRKSIRSYQGRRRLSAEHRAQLLSFLAEVNRNAADKSFRLVYVREPITALLITGTDEFIIAIMPKKFTSQHVLEIGRCLQNVILQLTRLGIGTCWIGGFQGSAVEGRVPDFRPGSDHVACLCAVGYASKNHQPMSVKYLQMPFSRMRFPMGHFVRDLKFQESGISDDDDDIDETTKKAFKAVRWGPSASNEQGTRIVKFQRRREGGPLKSCYHFFKSTLSMYYAKIGVGISMANWETTLAEDGITGRWVVDEDGKWGSQDIEVPSSSIEYMVTWIPDQGDRVD